jgi:hypothetical protein
MTRKEILNYIKNKDYLKHAILYNEGISYPFIKTEVLQKYVNSDKEQYSIWDKIKNIFS